jgi:spore germination protein
MKLASDTILETIKQQFSDCPDLITQNFQTKTGQTVSLTYFEGLCVPNLLSQDLVKKLLAMESKVLADEAALLTIPTAQLRIYHDQVGIDIALLAGTAILTADFIPFAMGLDFPRPDSADNSVPPEWEKSLYWPAESFSKQLNQNIAILRRKISSPGLKFKIIDSNPALQPKVAIAYLEGITPPRLRQVLEERLAAHTDAAGDSASQIEQQLRDDPHSPFPQYQMTQRPDLVTAALLTGRLAVLREANPLVFVTPTTFITFFQTPDDAQLHWLLRYLLQLVRFAASLIAVLLPGLYIALTSFHYQYLDFNLLLSLVQARLNAVMPPVLEVLLMEVFVTIFYEVSFRAANPAGILVGAVCGLLLGGTLLMTKLISPILLGITAFSVMAFFLLPAYHNATIRLLRLPFILLSSLFGVLGIALGASLSYAHLIVLKSLGQPYLQPLITWRLRSLFKFPPLH